MKCMFQHEERDQSDEESCDESDADDEAINKSKTEGNLITIDEIQPSLKKVENALEKVSELLMKQ